MKNNIYSLIHVPDIVILSETWLIKGTHINSEFELPDYKIIRCDRDYETLQLSRGGGVLLAIKNHLRD